MSPQKAIKLLLATGNLHKASEMRAILAGFPVETVSLEDIDPEHKFEEPEETGKNYLENALIKASYYGSRAGLPCLADDSGLEIDALDGAPGLYSHRFLSQCKNQDEKNTCVLELLKDRSWPERTARFRSVSVITGTELLGGQPYLTSEGVCEGHIAEEKSGQGGFGYDPIFKVDSQNRCMAELSAEQKNELSHRGQAVRSVVLKLLSMLQ